MLVGSHRDKRDIETENSPPMSAVRTLPALMTSKVALAMLFARWSRLQRSFSIMRSPKPA